MPQRHSRLDQKPPVKSLTLLLTILIVLGLVALFFFDRMGARPSPKVADPAPTIPSDRSSSSSSSTHGNFTDAPHQQDPIRVQSGVSSASCVEVEGTVGGDLIPGSTVSLFRVTDTNLSTVLHEIRATDPLAREVVNATKGFTFACVYPGIYAFVIPSSSYKGSRGSPLPYEFDCRNLSLDIAFQGGDSFYAVGAFSIFVPDERNLTLCTEPIEVCRAKRGRLYKKCPLE